MVNTAIPLKPPPPINGSLVYGVRVTPSSSGLSNPLEMGLARWA